MESHKKRETSRHFKSLFATQLYAFLVVLHNTAKISSFELLQAYALHKEKHFYLKSVDSY